jgi:N-methylhydantoinase B
MSHEQLSPDALEREYDPVMAEIIRERLSNIADEMATVMIRTSGNPILVEAVDFSTIILSPEGELDTYSAYVTFHHGPARAAVKHVLEVYDEDEINEGDQFICNDPFTTGNQHPPDVGLIKPIFYEDQPVAWSWAETNLPDVGGMGAGGIAPESREAYSDAIRFPGVKIVDEGEVLHDIRRMFYSNVRVPSMVFNDIRALIAANNRCEERLHETIDEFSLETFETYRSINKNLSEQALRNRIAELPDGTYTTTEYVEHDGEVNDLYELPIEVTINGSSLTMDFTGAAEQAPGFINITRGAAVGGAMTPIMFLLAPDIPANEGMFEPVEIVTPEGTIVNANLPAGLSTGHTETGLRMSRGLMKVLNRVIKQSESQFVREHAMAPFQDVWPVAAFYGYNQYGEPDIHIDMNGGGAGGGAMAVKDGLNCSGILAQLNNQLPDIERNEDDHPQLYLWRRLNDDSGGPGEYRGGLGHEYAWTLHESLGGEQTVTNAALEVPISGVEGGYSGGTNVFEIVQESDINELLENDQIPSNLKEVDGTHRQTEAKETGEPIGESTVFRNELGGGSGVGDPLKRSRQRVVDDVDDGLVSKTVAENVYGVVIRDGELDGEATAEQREAIRQRREEWSVSDRFNYDGDQVEQVRPFGRHVNVVEIDGNRRALQCGDCGSVFAPLEGPDDRSWTKHAATSKSPVFERFEELGLTVQEREGPETVYLSEHACPDCGLLCETDIFVSE